MPRIKKTSRRPLKRSKIAGASVTVGRCRNRPGCVASVIMRRDGKRVRIKYFATEGEAKAIAEQWTIEITNSGTTAASMLTDADKRAVADFYEQVQDWSPRPSLADALKQFLADHASAGVGLTVAQAADAHVDGLERRGLSTRHVGGTRVRLAHFVAKFGDRRLNSITGAEISKWIHGMKAAPATERNFKLAISPLFSDALKRGELVRNPLATVRTAKDRGEHQPEIFTPAEVTRFMATCPESIRAVMAIQFFGGLRNAEALRLTWDRVRMLEGVIDISVGTSKTASRRLVTISPNLRKWLEPLARTSGPVAPLPAAYRYQLDAHREALDFAWKDNGARHSFISYLMSIKEDAAYVANQAGNSPGVIHASYKALVTKREAESYFAIVPDTGEKVIQMPATAAS